MTARRRKQVLLDSLRSEFRRIADPRKAPMMQRYMKSSLPYHGVTVPGVRAVCRSVFKELTFPDTKAWENAVLELWTGAHFREELYAAVALTGIRAAGSFQAPEALPLYERLIVEGAWWDIVDDIAIHRLAPLVQSHPAPIERAMRAWSRQENLWKRRASIICQVGLKRDTDLKLLYDCIEPSIGSDEFFLRKAIGWALRQYAWTDPREVLRYVRARRQDLSPLSKREALKNHVRQGVIAAVP